MIANIAYQGLFLIIKNNMEYTEIHETEGVANKIQINRFSEDLVEIEGQTYAYPLPDKNYVLQMVVALDFTTHNADKTRYRYTLKRVGSYKLIAVPEGSV